MTGFLVVFGSLNQSPVLIRPAIVLALSGILLSPVTARAHDPSAWGGLFRSRDHGASWFPADVGLFIGAANAVATSPVDSNHLLYGTDTRLLRSRNGGRDWTHEASTQLFGPITSVAFDPDGGGALVANAGGIFRTGDGIQWEQIVAPSGALPARAIVPGSPAGRVYLAGAHGLFVSNDRGRSWSRTAEDLSDGPISVLVRCVKPREVLYAVTDGRLWASQDGALTWQHRDAGIPANRFNVLAPDLEDATRLWAGAADQVFTSQDGGATWRAVGHPLPEKDTSIYGIAVADAGRSIILTTHRGMFRSTDGAASWKLMEGNLPIHLEAGPLARDSHDAATLYAGYSLTPYTELWRAAEQGGNLLSRSDPVSLTGGAAFLVLLMVGGSLAIRWLSRTYRGPDPGSGGATP